MSNHQCVSVIVPIYNQQSYLNESIPSILEQSYQDLEILLVNDGSTDDSPELIRSFARQDSRIRIIEKENGGLVDATLAGINAATGAYICFLDPDDLIGKDYVKTFMDHMTEACDFVAAGFYYENKGVLRPYRLREDRSYSAQELRHMSDCFLYEAGNPEISNRFFISRWNKLYRASLVKKVAEEFGRCRGISLGEDTIFTYLMLHFAAGGRTIARPNSYYYNVGNQNSMMKSGQIDPYLQKSRAVYALFKVLTERFGTSDTQAYALYYHLVDALYQRALAGGAEQFTQLWDALGKDEIYRAAKQMMELPPASRLGAIKRRLKDSVHTPQQYLAMQKTIGGLRQVRQDLQKRRDHWTFWLDKCRQKGPIQAHRLLNFQRNRENAFAEMNSLLPEMEKRILPLLQPWLEQKTDLAACPVENNIFVFWWDGFASAPEIVRTCLDSIRRYHPGCNVIPIDRNNYRQYTDIDPVIIRDFEKDKISVQTFSDILRFNLLKNNGGIWIDSTIFFHRELNLLRDLGNKPFTTLAFSTSADFLHYGDEVCSWSGYFIASRKGSVFVRAVDEVFRKYYLKYRSYTTYFFIDIVLMICKKHHLDGDALRSPVYVNRSMFAMGALLGQEFDQSVIDYIQIPQKLTWNVGEISKDNTFYGWILSQ